MTHYKWYRCKECGHLFKVSVEENSHCFIKGDFHKDYVDLSGECPMCGCDTYYTGMEWYDIHLAIELGGRIGKK